MRGWLLALLVPALAAGAGRQDDAGGCPSGKRKVEMPEPGAVTIEPAGSGNWRITAERALDGPPARGSVVVRGPARPDPQAAPHARLAAARAWLALGEQELAARDWEKAIASAREGLQELGRDYARPEVDDSTQQKVLRATEQIAKGGLEHGAGNLLRMLRNRIELYLDRYQDAIVE